MAKSFNLLGMFFFALLACDGSASSPDGGTQSTGGVIGSEGNTKTGGTSSANWPTGTPTFTEFPMPTSESGDLFDLTEGPDGNIWFTQSFPNKVSYITPEGKITEFSPPTKSSSPRSIVTGPDGNVWFAETASTAYKIAKVTVNGEFTEYQLDKTRGPAKALAVGADNLIWFVHGVNYLGSITMVGNIDEIPIPSSTVFSSSARDYHSLIFDQLGTLWFLEAVNGVIVRYSRLGSFSFLSVPSATSSPQFGAFDSIGNYWFAESAWSKIGKVDLSDNIKEYEPVAGQSNIQGVTMGPDGAIWFCDAGSNSIGRVTSTVEFSKYSIPSPNSGCYDLIFTKDKSLWFLEQKLNKIGRLIFN